MSLEETKRRRKAISTIHDIVSAMRAISAGRIQSAQHALAVARRYQDTVLHALGAVITGPNDLPFPAGDGRPSMLLVFTAEQPLCGTFNQNVLALAERRCLELRREGETHLVVVGQRGVRQLVAGGLTPDAVEPAATSLPGLRDLVKRLAARVDRRFAAGELKALHVIYSRHQSVSEQIPTEERILPMDFAQMAKFAAPVGRPPYRYLSLPVLLAGLVSEYAFISLYRMAAESFASEQASRLVAMDGATRNTDHMLKDLVNLEQRERQGQITQQVLELIGARFAAGQTISADTAGR